MPEYKKITVESLVGRFVGTALSFDISKTSTGISVFRDGKVKSYAVQFDLKDEDSPYPTGERMKILEDSLDELGLLGFEFDLICVEEALLGFNAKTTSVAYALNYFIDYLLATGKLKAKTFVRINNKVWKKHLRTVTGVVPTKVGVDREKKDVIEALNYLEHPSALAYKRYKSWSAYMKSGYQDMLDSVGVLFGTVYQIYVEKKAPVRKRTKSVKIFGDLEKAMRFTKFKVVEEQVSPAKLSVWFKGLTERTNESTSYLVKVDSLGRFGVEKGYLERHDVYFVVVNLTVK